MKIDLNHRKAALVISHPGHEIRVHRWLEIARPQVFILTDGSGRTGRSRLSSTTAVLKKAGASPGSICGRFTDADIYTAILAGKPDAFCALARELADVFLDQKVDGVVGDALEGFNPSHDLCRYIINAAAALVEKETDRALDNHDFLLDGDPRVFREGCFKTVLDDGELQRKRAAADGYAELKSETETALAKFGEDAFRLECLRPVNGGSAFSEPPEDPPYYERYGEKQVSAGYYKDVIRYRRNIRPLVKEMRDRLGLEA